MSFSLTPELADAAEQLAAILNAPQPTPAPIAPQAAGRLPVVHPHKSAEWRANMAACRSCTQYRRGNVETCALDGRQCSTHALAGSCPTSRQPHGAGRRQESGDRRQEGLVAVTSSRPWYETLPNVPPMQGPPLGRRDWKHYFAAAWVINLDRAPDRLSAFHAGMPKDWPLPDVQRYRAIDGNTVAVPSDWREGAGAFGLYSTYRAIIERAITDGVDRPILLFEDDCRFVPDFSSLVQWSLANVPEDFDLLFLGAQSMGRMTPIAPGVRRMEGPHRTHSWAVHPRFFKTLLKIWQEDQRMRLNRAGHVDHAITRCASRFRVVGCDPFLTGQAAGRSFIGQPMNQLMCWDGRTASMFRSTGSDAQTGHAFNAGAKIGDLLYCLPLLRHVGGARLYYRHAIRDAYPPAELYRLLAPLLKLQPYVETFELGEARDGVDLEGWRRGNPKPEGVRLADHYRKHAKLDGVDYDSRWISVDRPTPIARVVLNRTDRYANGRFPWRRVVEQYGKDAVFVGSDKEHADFVSRFGHVSRHAITDYLDAARVLAGAELFVGNQSSLYALAEGMKMNTVQAVFVRNADCIFPRGNAVYGWDEDFDLPTLA